MRLNLHTADYARQLERDQRRFVPFTSYLSGIVRPPHDYAPVANQLGLAAFAERHIGSNFLNVFWLAGYSPN